MSRTRKIVYTSLGLIIPLYIAPGVLWELLILALWVAFLARRRIARGVGTVILRILRWWEDRKQVTTDTYP